MPGEENERTVQRAEGPAGVALSRGQRLQQTSGVFMAQITARGTDSASPPRRVVLGRYVNAAKLE